MPQTDRVITTVHAMNGDGNVHRCTTTHAVLLQTRKAILERTLAIWIASIFDRDG